MHEEFIEVSATDIEKLISKLNEPVIAVGTTSLRTLETLYWLGLQISLNKNISPSDLHLEQWIPYRQTADITPRESLHLLLEWITKSPRGKADYKTQVYLLFQVTSLKS